MFNNDQIREMTKRGYTLAQIAKVLGVNYNKLLQHCQLYDVPYTRYKGKYDQFIYENYGTMSFNEMGRTHGVSGYVMRNRAITLGIHTTGCRRPDPSPTLFMQHMTVAQAEEIVSLREADFSLSEVNRKTPSLKNWVVGKFIKYYGHHSPSWERLSALKEANQAFLREHGDTLIIMGRKGYTVGEMAELLDADKWTIRSFLRRGGHEYKRDNKPRRAAKRRKATKQPTPNRPAPKPQLSDPWKLALGIRA